MATLPKVSTWFWSKVFPGPPQIQGSGPPQRRWPPHGREPPRSHGLPIVKGLHRLHGLFTGSMASPTLKTSTTSNMKERELRRINQ